MSGNREGDRATMLNGTITVEAGLPSDAPMIAAFQTAMAKETENRDLDPATVARGVARVFEEPRPGFYIVGRGTDGVPVASLLVLMEWSDWRNTDVWWVHSVFVAPAYRRQGLFRRMLEHVEELARRAGAAGLRLYVERLNGGAKAVYTALGMDGGHYDLYEKMFPGM